jgi:hypothetical protein
VMPQPSRRLATGRSLVHARTVPLMLTICFRGARTHQGLDAFQLRVRRSALASKACSRHSLCTHSLARPKGGRTKVRPFPFSRAAA